MIPLCYLLKALDGKLFIRSSVSIALNRKFIEIVLFGDFSRAVRSFNVRRFSNTPVPQNIVSCVDKNVPRHTAVIKL